MFKFFTFAVVAVLSAASVQFAYAARPDSSRESARPAATCSHPSHNTYSEELGLEVEPTRVGLEVVKVDRRSPAEEADLREGDVIVEVNGRKPRSLQHFIDLAQGAQPAQLLVEAGRESLALNIDVPKIAEVYEIDNLGVEVEELEDGTLKVLSVDRRSLADDLEVQVGDVILEMNGDDVSRIRDLEDEVSDRMTLTVKAPGDRRPIELSL